MISVVNITLTANLVSAMASRIFWWQRIGGSV
jgi:hypothetical protein